MNKLTLAVGAKQIMDSVFKVKNITKQGFELYNLVNEKTYAVKSELKKVVNKRLIKGSYFTGRIEQVDGGLAITELDKSLDALSAHREAVSVQIKTPAALYEDNEEKFREVKDNVVLLGQKYEFFFKTKEVYTTNSRLNALLDLFNEFVDGKEPGEYEQYTENHVNADVVVFFDQDTGLQTLPKEKRDDFDRENFSTPTILYSSAAFEKFMELSSTAKTEKIGRNDPCVCGSGKKYKKCCIS